jgi:hypothetical protein
LKKKSRLRGRIRTAYLLIAVFALAIALSFLWEGPRTVYAHAIIICLDCIGLI